MTINNLRRELATIKDTDSTIDVKLSYQDRLDAINRAISTLRTREAACIRLYYGIGTSIYDDYKPKTDKTVGELFGVSGERAHQIRINAINHLMKLGPKVLDDLR